MDKKIIAILLCAGVGKRMNSNVPKQYMRIKGKEIIYYTIKAFEDSLVDEIIIVTGENDIEYCTEEIVNKYNFKKVSSVVAGGLERYNSVYNGLKAAEGVKYVLIHDGARPCILTEDINNIIACVKENNACIMAVNAKDTIKIVEDGYIIDSPNRKLMWQAQTPQAFEFKGIKNAYEKLIDEEIYNMINITDDASVWALANEEKVKIYEGKYTNIKITTPEDIEMANKYLE